MNQAKFRTRSILLAILVLTSTAQIAHANDTLTKVTSKNFTFNPGNAS